MLRFCFFSFCTKKVNDERYLNFGKVSVFGADGDEGLAVGRGGGRLAGGGAAGAAAAAATAGGGTAGAAARLRLVQRPQGRAQRQPSLRFAPFVLA